MAMCVTHLYRIIVECIYHPFLPNMGQLEQSTMPREKFFFFALFLFPFSCFISIQFSHFAGLIDRDFYDGADDDTERRFRQTRSM